MTLADMTNQNWLKSYLINWQASYYSGGMPAFHARNLGLNPDSGTGKQLKLLKNTG